MVSLPTVKVPGVIKSLGGVTVGVLGLDVGTALPLLLLLPQAASNKECSYTKYVLYISSVTSVPDCAQESIKLQTQTTVCWLLGLSVLKRDSERRQAARITRLTFFYEAV